MVIELLSITFFSGMMSIFVVLLLLIGALLLIGKNPFRAFSLTALVTSKPLATRLSPYGKTTGWSYGFLGKPTFGGAPIGKKKTPEGVLPLGGGKLSKRLASSQGLIGTTVKAVRGAKALHSEVKQIKEDLSAVLKKSEREKTSKITSSVINQVNNLIKMVNTSATGYGLKNGLSVEGLRKAAALHRQIGGSPIGGNPIDAYLVGAAAKMFGEGKKPEEIETAIKSVVENFDRETNEINLRKKNMFLLGYSEGKIKKIVEAGKYIAENPTLFQQSTQKFEDIYKIIAGMEALRKTAEEERTKKSHSDVIKRVIKSSEEGPGPIDYSNIQILKEYRKLWETKKALEKEGGKLKKEKEERLQELGEKAEPLIKMVNTSATGYGLKNGLSVEGLRKAAALHRQIGGSPIGGNPIDAYLVGAAAKMFGEGKKPEEIETAIKSVVENFDRETNEINLRKKIIENWVKKATDVKVNFDMSPLRYSDDKIKKIVEAGKYIAENPTLFQQSAQKFEDICEVTGEVGTIEALIERAEIKKRIKKYPTVLPFSVVVLSTTFE